MPDRCLPEKRGCRLAGASHPRSRKGAPAVYLLPLVLVAALMLACAPSCRPGQGGPEETAREFLRLWESGRHAEMYLLLDSASREQYSEEYFVNRYANISRGIGLLVVWAEPGEALSRTDEKAVFHFRARLETGPLGVVPVENTITLSRAGPEEPWCISWSPALIFPELTGNRYLHLGRTVPRRGSIFDRHGRPLAEYRLLYQVGVVPGKTADPASLVEQVAVLLDRDPGPLQEKLAQPWVRADLFVPLALLNPEQETLIGTLLAMPGVALDRVSSRFYPGGPLASHLVGCLGEVDAAELETLQKQGRGYYPGDLVGRMGLEAALEDILGGEFGFTLKVLEENGSTAAIIAERKVRDGRDVTLTIDRDVQEAAAEALGGRRGAVVVVDPSSGEVLALASAPAFDANWFVLGLSDRRWRELRADPGLPFFNRALAGLYPPGSVLKPLVAAAALEEKILDPDRKEVISGLTWQPSRSWGDYHIRRVKDPEKPVNLREAMQLSDNIYFARAGLALGPERFSGYMKRLGFGENLPFNLPAAISLVNKSGFTSEILLADSSYGQGEMLITPLHLALIYCVFPNRGSIPAPRLLLEAGTAGSPAAWKEGVFTAAVAAAVEETLIYTLEAPGSSSAAGRITGFQVAGKTGTAETAAFPGNACWYVTYAAGENPSPVVAVLVEEGGWAGTEALPLARAILERIIAPAPEDGRAAAGETEKRQ